MTTDQKTQENDDAGMNWLGVGDTLNRGSSDSSDSMEDDDWLGIHSGLELEEDELRDRFAIEAALRKLTNKIHSSTLDELFTILSQDIRDIFHAERVTIYVVDHLRDELFSKFKSGEEMKEIRVPLGSRSIAGFVAATGISVNVVDAYDEAALHAISEDLSFDISWDQKSGFRTREVLCVPIKTRKRVEGVIQLVNSTENAPFTLRHEQALNEISETLSVAFVTKKQLTVRRSPYDYLYDGDFLSPEMLDEAQMVARKESCSLGMALVNHFKIPRKELLHSYSRFYQTPAVEFAKGHPQPPDALLEKFTLDYLKHTKFVPLSDDGTRVVIAVSNPKDLVLRDQILQRFEGEKVVFYVAIEEDILDFVDLFYKKFQPEDKGGATPEELRSLIGEIEDEWATNKENISEEAKTAEVTEEDSGVVRLVNQIIEQAYHRGVSDIHIEPYPEGDLVVRCRIDGVCQEFMRLPGHCAKAMLSRLKIMSELDISERRLPQDGKIKYRKYGALDIELRVATLPTTGGVEDCVMRILASSEPLPLSKMGFMPEVIEKFEATIIQPYGLCLVVGPTGSGKTTTLHSALGFINKPERKIWTAEDPVEITQKGLRQVQVKPKIGFDFARAMKAFLRADPDVIMIGEMRDAETAEAGIEASLTGHMVFSTLHTNSAPETVSRLLDMELDPFSFGDSLLGVLAQRLIRTLCKQCKQPREPEPGEIEALKHEFGGTLNWERLKLEQTVAFQAKVGGDGCAACGGSGYKGRMGIHEFMANSDELRMIIYRHGKVSEMREQAEQEGMTTLKQDGIRKVLLGHTDIAEVRRVCIK